MPDSVKENPHVKVFLAMDELPEDVIRANEETAAAWREQKIHERVEKRLDSAERRREQAWGNGEKRRFHQPLHR